MRVVLIQPALRFGDSPTNCAVIESLIAAVKDSIRHDDIILLPEHFMHDDNPDIYDSFLDRLTNMAGCAVVGGSHNRILNGKRVNFGSVRDGRGNIIGEYSKLRPYFNEGRHVSPGDMRGEVTIRGKNFLILICADFWYSDIFMKAGRLPDVVLVPALSVSRKSAPDYSRALWRHFTIQRAFEFGVYVGISDWSADSILPQFRTCGVGGFADPAATDPGKLFTEIDNKNIAFFDLDFDALERFRDDRRMRGFFWR